MVYVYSQVTIYTVRTSLKHYTVYAHAMHALTANSSRNLDSHIPLGLALNSASISDTSFLGRLFFASFVDDFVFFNSACKLFLSRASTDDGERGALDERLGGLVSRELRLSTGRFLGDKAKAKKQYIVNFSYSLHTTQSYKTVSCAKEASFVFHSKHYRAYRLSHQIAISNVSVTGLNIHILYTHTYV